MRLLASSLFVFLSAIAMAQDRYWIYFDSKECSDYTISEDHHPKAIERRVREGRNLNDETDWPIARNRVEAVELIVDSLRIESRWLNAVSVQATSAQIRDIKALPFVRAVESFHFEGEPSRHIAQKRYPISRLEEHAKKQTEMLGRRHFHDQKITGDSVIIAVLDAGFRGVDHLPQFTHLTENHQIIGTKDFVGNDESVFERDAHGTSVLSCIAGLHEEIPLGLATNAQFLLAITENVWR
ncbi:MAG: hypothetical protein AAF193_02645, partial [Bacteroidota bacterium]